MKKPIREAEEYYLIRRPICPYCGSYAVIKITSPTNRIRWQCQSCFKTFYLSEKATCVGELNVVTWRTQKILQLVEEEKKRRSEKNGDKTENSLRK